MSGLDWVADLNNGDFSAVYLYLKSTYQLWNH